jgi:hypothetical protein
VPLYGPQRKQQGVEIMATQSEQTRSGAAPEQVHKGQCFCGEVGIEAQGEPEAMGYCHCQSCRSASGAAVRGFTLWPKDAVRVTRGEDKLAGYNKTGFSDRQHCTNCGGAVLIQHPTLGMTDIHSSTIPNFDFRPAVHLNYQESVLPIRDGLPKLKDFPAEIGGSGETMEE